MGNPYDDIIKLPHHVSSSHPQMPREDRAAQFSPFAALTGYEHVIREAGRITDEKRELDEDAKQILNEKLQRIQRLPKGRQNAEITYFRPDEKKDGGTYITVAGPMKKIDLYQRVVVMEDGERIPIENIAEVEELE